MTSSDHRKLVSAICIGRMSLKHRVVIAPLTRFRSLQPGDVPGDLMREYYTGAAGASLYSASKHAVEGLTKSAALEAAPSGVRVNMAAPGPIHTGMLKRFTGPDERKAGLAATVPRKRVGRPEEIARTIVFLASDKASFITGESYLVAGGKQPSHVPLRSDLGWPRQENKNEPDH